MHFEISSCCRKAEQGSRWINRGGAPSCAYSPCDMFSLATLTACTAGAQPYHSLLMISAGHFAVLSIISISELEAAAYAILQAPGIS